MSDTTKKYWGVKAAQAFVRRMLGMQQAIKATRDLTTVHGERLEAAEASIAGNARDVETLRDEATAIAADLYVKTAEASAGASEAYREALQAIDAASAADTRARKAQSAADEAKNAVAGKADRSELSNVLAEPSQQAVESIEQSIVANALRKNQQTLTPQEREQVRRNLAISKMELFCDLFNEAAGDTGHAHMTEDGTFDCRLNGLELSYGEAVTVYVNSVGARNTRYLDAAFNYSRIRTNLPLGGWTMAEQGYHLSSAFRGCKQLEVANLYSGSDTVNTRLLDGTAWIFSASKLREVRGVIEFVDKAPHWNGFEASLEEIRIARLAMNISFQLCPLLSLASLQFMIANAANTSAITVTAHPDVYAKLTGDTTNAAAAALTAEELAQWNKVLADATEKNIAFATTA